jgi:uncharacterized protein (DUF885 family)
MPAMAARAAILLLLAGCAMPQDVSPSLAGLYDRYLAERAALDPDWAASVGLHEHDARVTRWDDASYRARLELAERWIERVGEDSLDARLWRAELLAQRYEGRRRDPRTVCPGLPFGAVSSIHDMLVKDYAPKETRLDAVRRRLAEVPAMIAEIRAKLGRPPAVWTRMAIDDGKGTVEFLEGLKDVDGLPAAKAYAEYVAWMEKELLPRSDGSFVMGREAYEFHLRNDHFLAHDVEALEKLGREEFDKTLRMLEAIEKDWPALLEAMKKDHPTPAGLVARYAKEVEKARAYMSEKALVGIPAWEKLEVVETPEFLRSTIPYAAYSRPGPLDTARTGHFYVTPVEKGAAPEVVEEQLAAHNVYDIPGTVWHEAYPGHHLQFVYAKDIASKVRKLNESPLLSEGWGLYCEELAHETGYYTDRRERVMQLNWRLQRAARVLLDVSLHTGKMSFDAAVAFLVDQVRLNKAQAEGSVKAYTVSPTYFPTYLLGLLEIARIREACRARLGSRFTLKEFHERFLAFGNVPPALIEAELLAEWR